MKSYQWWLDEAYFPWTWKSHRRKPKKELVKTGNNIPSNITLEENAGPSFVSIARAQPQGMLGLQRGFAPGEGAGEDLQLTDRVVCLFHQQSVLKSLLFESCCSREQNPGPGTSFGQRAQEKKNLKLEAKAEVRVQCLECHSTLG